MMNLGGQLLQTAAGAQSRRLQLQRAAAAVHLAAKRIRSVAKGLKKVQAAGGSG